MAQKKVYLLKVSTAHYFTKKKKKIECIKTTVWIIIKNTNWCKINLFFVWLQAKAWSWLSKCFDVIQSDILIYFRTFYFFFFQLFWFVITIVLSRYLCHKYCFNSNFSLAIVILCSLKSWSKKILKMFYVIMRDNFSIR